LCELYEDVSHGITEYGNLFQKKGQTEIEKVVSGNDFVRFADVKVKKTKMVPGDSFEIQINYESLKHYPDVDIDIAIYSSHEPNLHFQATNKAYNVMIDLFKGENKLEIIVENMRINRATALITIAIWPKNRSEYLFWWRIPVEFEGVNYSTGNNFLDVSFRQKSV
jgi:hypothetical protein